MTQGFYTLEEAANLLGMAPDDLNRMAQRREIRAFADRGTWRFRTQDIDEMAQKQGAASPSGTGSTGVAPSSASGSNLAPSGTGSTGVAPSPSGTGSTGLTPSSSGTGTTGISPSGMEDISFEDISLDELPMDEAPKTHLSPRKAVTGVAGAGLDEDLIPLAPMPDAPGESAVSLGEMPPAGLPDTHPKPGSSGRLAMEQGSFEFDLDAGGIPPGPGSGVSKPPSSGKLKGGDSGVNLGSLSSPKLGSSAKLKGPSSGKLGSTSSAKMKSPSSGRVNAGGDSDVRLDFDGSTVDDSLVNVGKPDSDVRLDPLSSRGPGAADVGPTEEIDLDAELQQADLASQRRILPPKTKAVPGKTQAPPPAQGTMLPTSSPFELSEDDLELSPSTSGSGSGGVYQPAGSEFELTLAPEDEPHPLALGDDEDVDLGDLKPSSELSSSARAELSGINLHDPADSGISLEKGGGSSDSVDFELTVDDDSTGPKTIKGKVPDSDSEFELTLEDSSGEISAGVEASSDSGEQKDIFETDFDLPALEESGSQAVALDESDTDLESSDFDLALEEGETSSTAEIDESGSQVVQLDEEVEGEAPAPRKKTRGFSAIHGESEGELVLDEDEAADIEREAEGEETEPATIPAAQAEWGWYPILVLVPCVAIMFVAGLMSYELLHGMWGYHSSSKPSGMVVRGMAGLFTDVPNE
jgi:excisionase family DNA binding protein